jgi:hypothetical protein
VADEDELNKFGDKVVEDPSETKEEPKATEPVEEEVDAEAKVQTQQPKPEKKKKPKKPFLQRLKFYIHLAIFLFFVASGALLSLPMWKHKLPEFMQKYIPESLLKDRGVANGKDYSSDIAELQSRIDEIFVKLSAPRASSEAVSSGDSEAFAQNSTEISNLRERVETYDARISEIEGKLVSIKAMSAAMKGSDSAEGMDADARASVQEMFVKLSDELTKELNAQLEQRAEAEIAPLQSDLVLKADSASVDAKLKSLQAQIEEVQKIAMTSSSLSKASSAMIIASLRLKDKVEEGKPFTDGLKNFRDAMYEEDAFKAGEDSIKAKEEITGILKGLGEYAEEGVSSVASLREEFDKAARTAVAIASTSADAEGWSANALNKMRSMVVVRKMANAEKGSVDDIAYRASNYLRNGEVKAAIDAVEEIKEENAKAVFDAWLEKAMVRLSAIKLASTIAEQCIGGKFDKGAIPIAQSDVPIDEILAEEPLTE